MRKWLGVFLLMVSAYVACGQNLITFRVVDDSGEPLTGASVSITGTTSGAITNLQGMAMIDNLPDGDTEFIVSFVGYEDYKIALSFPLNNSSTIEIHLQEGELLEEVVISTTRSSRSIRDIPTRIEFISSEELGEQAAMNSSNIGMLLRETTGVQMQQTSLSSGNLSIRIQGLDGRYTQILKDGIPLYGGFAGGLSIMQIPPLDLKQVELIKGSNSTLYGGGAIAGLVNLISIEPEEKPRLDIMFNQTSALGSSGNIFLAKKYDKAGFTLYGAANNQLAYDPDHDGFSNLPKARTLSLNPRIFFYPDPRTEVNLGINTTLDNRTGGDMEVLKGNTTELHQFSEDNRSERISSQFMLKNSKDNRTLSAKNGISYFNRELRVPQSHFNGHQLSSFSELLYYLHKSDRPEWQIGLNHYLESFSEEETDTLISRSYSHSTVGGFIQNTTDLSESLVFEAGLRTDYNAEYGIFILPRFSLLYRVTEKLSARIGGARAYKLPTIFTEDAERLYFMGIAPISPDLVEAETSLGGNFDINYRTALSDRMTLSVNHLFFLTRINHALVLREGDSGDQYFFESAAGPVLSSGFETNLKMSYLDFKIYANYAYINTELQYDHIYRQNPLTPKHNFGMALMYELEDKWTAGYELYYTGKQFDNAYDLKPHYWMMGIMVMRIFERFSVFINFENFTNVIQSNYEPLVYPPLNSPTFPDIWAPTDGFVFNGGFILKVFGSDQD